VLLSLINIPLIAWLFYLEDIGRLSLLQVTIRLDAVSVEINRRVLEKYWSRESLDEYTINLLKSVEV